MLTRQLSCPYCGWRTIAPAADLFARLKLIGLLRRDKQPDEEIIAALLPEAVTRMTCPTCKRVGLRESAADAIDDFDNDAAVGESGDWQAAVLCEACREPIDPERLEVFPNSRRCVDCQGKEDRGELDHEPKVCPRCGAAMEIRVSQARGKTRYRLFCSGIPSCSL